MSVGQSYAIWICSWYTSKLQPFLGDFVQRHAQAVSEQMDVVVVHVVKDTKGSVTKDVKIETTTNGGLKEIIVYYYIKSVFKAFDGWRSYRRYRQLVEDQVKSIIKERGRPELLHSYISWKGAPVTASIARRMNLPWVISEQWTTYLPQSERPFHTQPRLMQAKLIRALREADSVMAVSEHLGEQLARLRGRNDIKVVPNVVNSRIFYPVETDQPPRDFIHISGMSWQKNPELILHAFRIFKQSKGEGKLHMAGGRPPRLVQLAEDLGIGGDVVWYDEIPQQQLNALLQQCRALLFPSRYETFGCVAIEAMQAGVPVIGSDAPTIAWLIGLGEGIVVDSPEPEALASSMFRVPELSWAEREGLAAAIQSRFGYPAVAAQFLQWYREVLKARPKA